MSLDSKLLALAQAVGADIKALAESGGGSVPVRGETLISSYTTVPAGNSVTLLTFSIPSAGTWEIEYFASAFQDGIGSTYVYIVQPNTQVVPNSYLHVRNSHTTYASRYATAAGRVVITTTEGGTYKLDAIAWDVNAVYQICNSTTGGTKVQWTQLLSGPAGADGQDGSNGDDGASAYEVAVANGFVGTEAEWLVSLVGDAGPSGGGGQLGYLFKKAWANSETVTVTLDTPMDGMGKCGVRVYALDYSTAFTAFSLRGDTLLDRSELGLTVSSVAATANATGGKFGPRITFGANGELSVSSTYLQNLLGKNWTARFWFTPQSANDDVLLLSQWAGASGHWILYLYADGRLSFGLTGVNETTSSALVWTVGVPRHIEVSHVADGSTYIFVDGALVITAPSSRMNNSTNPLRFGASASNAMSGDLADIDVFVGWRLHTAAFTPPTEESIPTNAGLLEITPSCTIKLPDLGRVSVTAPASGGPRDARIYVSR